MEIMDLLINYVGVPIALVLSIAISIYTFWKVRVYDVQLASVAKDIEDLRKDQHVPYPDIESIIPAIQNAITALETNNSLLMSTISELKQDGYRRHKEVLAGLEENRKRQDRMFEAFARFHGLAGDA